ncbi:MAG TPA: peptidase MA family metallohydrolase [Anaerolineales bacterium]|nr:peptidase MA family metallohydrolase [Anaerolineales bacterium]
MHLRKILSVLLLLAVVPVQSVFAAAGAEVQDDAVVFDFPNTATFSATLKSAAAITAVTLEYGNEQQTCGEVIAKAFPQFDPSTTVQVEWTWDMRQSGSLPPGSTIWWRWRYTDESGAEFVSDQKTAIWLDDVHNWQTLSSDELRVHWYDNDKAFAQTMLDAGTEGLRRNREQAGLSIEDVVDIYVYPNYDDMRDAILYEPSWTGGMAFSDHNIVIMGISASDSNWDKNTVIHELTHVLVGHFTFSCIGTVPTWLNEGLAMFSEGELDSYMQSQLDDAIKNDTLLTIRSLNGGFSELPDKANLSYSQSHSIVEFLISTYGQDKMTEILAALRDAKPIDDALIEVYGFDTDGLEDAWREAIGAAPRTVSAQPTAQPTPTFVPTYVPVSGAPLAVTPTPYSVPTSSFVNTTPPVAKGPPIALTIALICMCGVILLILGVMVIGILARSQNQKAGKNG